MKKEQLLKLLKRQRFDSEIVDAFSRIKREDFVEKDFKNYAYENEPLPIARGATISQPSTIAFMLQLLELKDDLKILEMGSGCGYVLALMNEISKNSKIHGVERIKELVDKSKKILKKHKNISIICADGTKGLKEKAGFDRILISAASDKIPEHLFEQLSDDGILVCPVRNSIFQIKKTKDEIIEKEFKGFAFVPLIKD